MKAFGASRPCRHIPDVPDLADVAVGACGKRDHLFFRNNPDHSRIFVFFNGEIPAHLLGQGPTFQRWTWASDFSNPVLCVSDASVDGRDDLQIGWYVADRDGGTFDDLMDLVEDVCTRTVGKNAEIVCVGSSAGGFAALMAACRNRCDGAVVFNPQVDIMRYRERAISRFMARFCPDMGDSSGQWGDRTSLIESIPRYSARAKIVYWQNTDDHFHFRNHCKNFRDAVARLPAEIQKNVSFNFYTDPVAGHNPPTKERFLAAIERAYPGATNGRPQTSVGVRFARLVRQLLRSPVADRLSAERAMLSPSDLEIS
ncbi:prolyl oligopeptidase family serine peptidase [Kumtagia ephedrae]|uniref:prolyl oligopeptidase family serine peptidase n=1 Tax=Kumtagia ephedrae TaxID=2116701 RepID=UPI0014033A3C|nr:prolyl oligopeptidase family serine peptidase [Mesorhizobium ephedrae]